MYTVIKYSVPGIHSLKLCKFDLHSCKHILNINISGLSMLGVHTDLMHLPFTSYSQEM